MKSIIYIALIAFFGIQTEVNAQGKQMDNFEVQVDGLGCPFCAYGLEKKFKEFKGIKKVAIDMETGIMTFIYPEEKMLSLVEIENQVEEAGYTPVRVAIMRANGQTEFSDAKIEDEKKDVDMTKMIEKTFFVSGNCAMCKARIEKAAMAMDGVGAAEWDEESKMLLVKLDEEQTSQAEIESVIAKAGHDTKTAKTTDERYEKLPMCCKYSRI